MATPMMRFIVSDWSVNVATNECIRDNQTVKLESKVMAVLHYFAQHKGELISREQLEQDIWGDTVVGYDAVTGCIAKLRKILGDDPKQPRYIETISKKGYRFIAEVSEPPTDLKFSTSSVINQPAKHLKFYITVVLLLTITSLGYSFFSQPETTEPVATSKLSQTSIMPPSIVVLPFNNMSSDPEQQYFSDGIYADIYTGLSKLSGLLVIAPSSAENFRQVNTTPDQSTIKQITADLGVRYILQGNVRKAASRLRMNVSLLDGRNNQLLWSEKYDRDLVNMFDVQDEITAQIINTLSITLTKQEKRNTAKRYTQSFSAYDEFLKGQSLYIKHNHEDNLQAREQFNLAILLDEKFARAYSSIALTYVAEHRYRWRHSSTDKKLNLLDQAFSYANKGITLDNRLPQSYWVLAYVNLFQQDYEAAATAAEHSIRIAPNYADSYISLAVCKLHLDLPEQALALIKKAMLINPRYPAAYASVLGQIYFATEDYEAAAHTLNNAIERNINLLTPHIFLVAALAKLNRLDDAQWSADQIRVIAPAFTLADVNDLIAVRTQSVVTTLKQQLQQFGFNK